MLFKWLFPKVFSKKYSYRTKLVLKTIWNHCVLMDMGLTIGRLLVAPSEILFFKKDKFLSMSANMTLRAKIISWFHSFFRYFLFAFNCVPIPCFIFGGVKSVNSMDILVSNHFRARGFSAFWSISWLMSLACKLAIKRFMWAELSHMRLRECLISFYLATNIRRIFVLLFIVDYCKLFRIAVSLW